MQQKNSNQEHARKYGGSSSFVDQRDPSKAPRQDEDAKDFVGPSDTDQPQQYNSIGEQGISNRLAEEEHAFPEPAEPDPASDIARDSVDATPKQQGGNRGGV